MKKSFVISALLAILTISGFSYSFAAEDMNSNNNETNLGNTITESMNKAGDNVENVVKDVVSNNNTINGMRNSMSDMTNGIKNATSNAR